MKYFVASILLLGGCQMVAAATAAVPPPLLTDREFLFLMALSIVGGLAGLGWIMGKKLTEIKNAADCVVARTAILEDARAIEIMIAQHAPEQDIADAQQALAKCETKASEACP